MSGSRYPITHNGTLIPGHALHKWRRRKTATQRSLTEAYDEAIIVHSDDVHGRSYLHSPTDLVFVTQYDGARETLKTVLRDDGDIHITEREDDASTPLRPCDVCGNDYYTTLSEECPWCLDTGIVL